MKIFLAKQIWCGIIQLSLTLHYSGKVLINSSTFTFNLYFRKTVE